VEIRQTLLFLAGFELVEKKLFFKNVALNFYKIGSLMIVLPIHSNILNRTAII
jgi:hypothetical protein